METVFVSMCVSMISSLAGKLQKYYTLKVYLYTLGPVFPLILMLSPVFQGFHWFVLTLTGHINLRSDLFWVMVRSPVLIFKYEIF